jgi:hypothetical protein
MKRILAAMVLAVLLAPSTGRAEERAGDAALGALSGAIVLGPVGAVAGAFIGYTSGPAIGHSWGLRGSQRRHPGRSANRSRLVVPKGASVRHAAGQGISAQPPAAHLPTQPAGPPATSAQAPNAMPPVQSLE